VTRIRREEKTNSYGKGAQNTLSARKSKAMIPRQSRGYKKKKRGEPIYSGKGENERNKATKMKENKDGDLPDTDEPHGKEERGPEKAKANSSIRR